MCSTPYISHLIVATVLTNTIRGWLAAFCFCSTGAQEMCHERK